ncbi:hypothetical protein GCM10020358_83660 [Amorphoplanes nipponensis]
MPLAAPAARPRCPLPQAASRCSKLLPCPLPLAAPAARCRKVLPRGSQLTALVCFRELLPRGRKFAVRSRSRSRLPLPQAARSRLPLPQAARHRALIVLCV